MTRHGKMMSVNDKQFLFPCLTSSRYNLEDSRRARALDYHPACAHAQQRRSRDRCQSNDKHILSSGLTGMHRRPCWVNRST